jgi:hypothetical protein
MQGLALGEDAFALVGVRLQNPKACEMASYARDTNTGISISFFRMMDPTTRVMINRFDCMLGFGNFYPDAFSARLLAA